MMKLFAILIYIGETVNNFLNENQQELFNEYKKDIFNQIGGMIKSMINAALVNFPVDKFLQFKNKL